MNEQQIQNGDFANSLLMADFQSSYEMLRHYNDYHWDVTKFCFSQICVIIGACWYVVENKTKDIEGIPVIPLLLIISGLFTFLCILTLTRNRVYFVKVSHYINELRNKSIEENSIGFRNEAKMWCDLTYPPTKDFFSTQMLCTYLLTLCCICLFCIASYILVPIYLRVCITSIVGIIALIVISLCICRTLRD